ncbi:MAG TPA: succinate CoA transferase [Acidobacteriota bacterium]|nr:succinate CoA transferase [Acidobacteriota bacterium]HQF86942.1 succinate CoA transferase [Acidobacteriota bacterium]HQG91260.1 succinate CoA transferase [Acidobacteriota bacterium]
MKNRIRHPKLSDKITTAEEAADLIQNGMNVGCSGFTPAGYPKLVPKALAERIKRTGEKTRINLFTGASVGDELDGALAEVGAIDRRMPYQSNKKLRDQINAGATRFYDQHLSHVSSEIRYGYFGPIDVAVIEAHAITEEGHLVPTTSVGISPTLCRLAKTIIVELNTTHPLELEGIHDIYVPQDQPDRQPIPIVKASNRIGRPYMVTDVDRIRHIVVSDKPDSHGSFTPCSDAEKRIAELIIDFITHEIRSGRMPRGLPWQSGVGGVANAVLQGFLNSEFQNMEFYSEVIQDSVLDLIDAGKVVFASGTSITLSAEGEKRFHQDLARYKRHILLRPQEMSNNPEIIRRLGVIAVNTALEADIYGHVNSTHVMGTHLMNGIGGSGDFERNAYLSIFVTPSVAKGGKISSIVPFVTHFDHSEHDVKVVVTEQGLADLRGKCPREVAPEIIRQCVHPDYRDELMDYYERACREVGGHEPHLIREVFQMHTRYMDTGDMRKPR